MKDSKTKKSRSYIAVIVALITLFNPNINLIDILPDFIGYYLLSRVFLRPSFSCPHFEEARRGFIRLFWLSLLKIPAFVAMILIRSANTQDNDVVALMALVFCIIELILLLPTVKQAFEALIYLAGRRELNSVLSDENPNSTASLRSLTLIYFIFKCVAYAAPEFLRLTRMMDIGSQTVVATGSKIYPFAVVGIQAIGYILGAVWLARAIGFVSRVRAEGKFYPAVLAQESGIEENRYEKAISKSHRKTAHLMLLLAALASFEIVFDNYKEINLLPPFLSYAFILISACMLWRFVSKEYSPLKRATVISASILSLVSVAGYAVSIVFLTRFGYTALYKSVRDAKALYSAYEIISLVTLVLYLITLVLFTLLLRAYIRENFGIRLSDSRYGRLEAEYHRGLSLRIAVFSVIAGIGGIAKFLSIIFKGSPTAYEGGTIEMPSIIIGSAVPWFNIITVGASVILSLYAVYLCGLLNQEIKDGYSE